MQQASIRSDAVNLLKAWLPVGAIEQRPAPTVTFIVFARDARGVSRYPAQTTSSVER